MLSKISLVKQQKQKTRCAKKRENMTHTQKKSSQNMLYLMDADLDLAGKDFKATIINLFKGERKPCLKSQQKVLLKFTREYQ